MIGLELLQEKSLWQIYCKCLRSLKPSYFNVYATGFIILMLSLDAYSFPEHYRQRLALIRSLSELGLGFGSTILGFLIAGFTIFSTLSRSDLFLRMHQTRYERTNLTYLQVNFFTFVEVFVVYAFFMVVCLLIKLFGSEGGLLVGALKFTEVHPFLGYKSIPSYWVNLGFVLFGTLSLYSLLALKSFIFNTYHSVMTSVVWAFNPPDNTYTQQQEANS